LVQFDVKKRINNSLSTNFGLVGGGEFVALEVEFGVDWTVVWGVDRDNDFGFGPSFVCFTDLSGTKNKGALAGEKDKSPFGIFGGDLFPADKINFS